MTNFSPFFPGSDGLVTLRYPPNWFAEVRPTPPPSPPATSYTIGYLFSLDPSVATGPDLPRNAAKIDVEVDLPEVNDCRSQPADAIPAALGGVAGWRQTRAALADDGDFRGIFVAAYLDGRCFRVLGHFGPENHDDSIFEQIVSSFAFSQTGQ